MGRCPVQEDIVPKEDQRRGPVRVHSGSRTVSEPAVMVIAGVIPIDLLAKERRAVYLRKAELGKDMAKHP